MKSPPKCSQPDMFGTPTAGPITLELKGIQVKVKHKGKPDTLMTAVPSFKTGKTAFAWEDKATKKLMARPLTLPEHKHWMELATRSIELQFLSALQITAEKMRTVASPRSWIASLVPLDDSWTWCPEINVKCEKCEPGEEGAVIRIERIS